MRLLHTLDCKLEKLLGDSEQDNPEGTHAIQKKMYEKDLESCIQDVDRAKTSRLAGLQQSYHTLYVAADSFIGGCNNRVQAVATSLRQTLVGQVSQTSETLVRMFADCDSMVKPFLDDLGAAADEEVKEAFTNHRVDNAPDTALMEARGKLEALMEEITAKSDEYKFPKLDEGIGPDKACMQQVAVFCMTKRIISLSMQPAALKDPENARRHAGDTEIPPHNETVAKRLE